MSETPTEPQAPRCGRCNYIVRGISSLTCPECGGDLREVGIDVGQRRRSGWGPILVLAIVWTVVVLVLSQLAWDGLRQSGARVADISYSVSFQGPASGQYTQLLIDGIETKSVRTEAQLYGSQLVPRARLTLIGQKGTLGYADVDIAADSFKKVAPDGTITEEGPFLGQYTIKDWLSKSTNSTEPKLLHEAVQIAAMLRAGIDQHKSVLESGSSGYGSSGSGWRQTRDWTFNPLFADGVFASAGGSSTVAAALPAWYAPTIAITGILLWIAGIYWLLRRFGRTATRRPGDAAATRP